MEQIQEDSAPLNVNVITFIYTSELILASKLLSQKKRSSVIE